MEIKTSHPKRKGIIAEEIIKCHFVKRGETILVPVGDNERYDFVIHKDNNFIRVQAKLGRKRNGKLLFSTHSVNVNLSGISYSDYLGSADVFAILEPESEMVYMIPVSECPRSGRAVLRIDEPKTKHTSKARFARDFLVP